MRVSYRWLTEILPGLTAPPEEVAQRLTNAGLEVEAVVSFGAPAAVVVAQVLQIEPHPKRDKLRLVTVDRGSGTAQRVVCGAANVPAPGGLLALAPLGTTLPAVNMLLTPREIGGIVSEGMLCSERELGLAEVSDGILILPEGCASPGTPLSEAIPGSRDVIFELGITPNRADALSHLGVARDLAALFGLDCRRPEARAPERLANAELASMVTVRNEDLERCPHYGAAVVLEIKVAPSPLWLRYRLQSLGVRPINNIVDVTNLILFETGQPLHAFDLDRVRDQTIVIRRARSGEPFTTLDGVARQLDADDLVICDGQGPTALAGVMGGQDSEIRTSTSRVLLECAYFTPQGVRRTSRRHGLSTDASHRYERGIDWAGVPSVLERAASLIAQLGGGARVPGSIHAKAKAPQRPEIRLRSARLNALLGLEVPFAEATERLRRLGFEILEVSGEGSTATALVRSPSFRPDVELEADLIDEVARLGGLDAIPTVLPRIAPQTPRISGKLEREARATAVNLGLSEALTYSFVSRRELQALSAPEPSVTLINPLTEERSVLRTSLLPGLIEALRRARRRGERAVRLFSLGPIFLPPAAEPRTGTALRARPEMPADHGQLPEERPSFAALIAGPRPAHLAHPETDVYDAKGIAVEMVERITGHAAAVELAPGRPETRHLHPRGAALLKVGAQTVGRFGPLHPEVVEATDLDGPAFAVELDLAAIELLSPRIPRFQPIPRLPAIQRDISLELGEELPAGELGQKLRAAAGPLCESVELTDVFSGKPIPDGFRSLTYRLTYRDPRATSDPDQARTLTDKEVDDQQALVIQAAEALGAKQRA